MKLKKIIIVVLCAFTFSCPTSCLKKGEDDPAISFRTRKNRLTGNWKIKSGTDILTGGYNPTTGNHVNKITTIYSEDSYQRSSDEGNSTNVISGALTYNMEFKKDGEFTATIFYENLTTNTLKGTWNFTDNIGGHNKKDQIVINFTSRSYIPAGPNSVEGGGLFGGNQSDLTYHIKELRNTKIVLVSEYSSTDNNGVTYTTSSNLTFIQ